MASVQDSPSIMELFQSWIPSCLRGDQKHRTRPHTMYDKDDLNRLLQDFTSQEHYEESPAEEVEEQRVTVEVVRNEQLAALMERLDLLFGAPDVLDDSERILRLDLRRFLGFNTQSTLLGARVLSAG